MKTSVARVSLVYLLISLAKAVAFLESRVFAVLLKFSLAILVVYALTLNRLPIENFYSNTDSTVRTFVWYKTLPADYFAKQDQESKAVFARYLEALKPKSPEKVSSMPFPVVSAKSYLVIDRASDTSLVSKDTAITLPPASTAKLATALASLKLYKLDEEITVPQFCTQVDGTKAGLLQGQRFLVGDLLKALLVYSAGDAGCTLSIGKTSYADFIVLMNQVAKDNDLKNTKFTNPIGLDDADGTNLSSAEDLAKLGIKATENDFIKEVVKIKEFELKDLDGRYATTLANTNKLLIDIPESVGIKTGTTTGAGEVLIYEYVKDKVDLVTVVMGSTDRFKDTTDILSWVLQSYVWEK